MVRWLIAAATLVSGALAFEGRVEMKMYTYGKRPTEMPMVYSIKGTKMRTDTTIADKKGKTQTFGSILNWETQEMLMLMDEQKMYMVVSLKEAAEKAAKQSGDAGKFEFKPTGRKEVIAGVEAEEWAGISEGKRVEVWVTKTMGKFMMGNSGGNPMAGGKAKTAAWEQFMQKNDFFTLRTIVRPKEGAPEEMKMEVQKIEKKSLPDSLFVPPADYQKFAMPSMGDMMKGMIPGGR